jgi:hypothetical protein
MQRREFAVPAHPDLTLRIYGVDKARDLSERMAQGFCVVRDQVAVARAELSPVERSAVQAYLDNHHPEHATL